MNDEISFVKLLIKLKKNSIYTLKSWKILTVCTIFGVLIGWIFSNFEKETFTAELTFTIENDKPLYLGGNLTSILGFDLGGSSNEGVFSNDNMLELFNSRRMIEKTLLSKVPNQNQTFADLYCVSEKIKTKYSFPLFTSKSKKTLKQDSILGEIYSEIKLNYFKIKHVTNNILELELKYKNELFAKYFLETLANVVSNDYNEMKTKKSKMNMLALQNQVDSVKNVLNNQINESQLNKNSKMNQIEIEINSKLLSELIKQSELSKVALRKDTPLIQIIDNPILPLKTNKTKVFNNIILGGMIFFLISYLLIMFVKSNFSIRK